jgi:hypothetical protein
MPNKRISELNERTSLRSDSPLDRFGDSALEYPAGSINDDLYFLIAREKVSNEKVKYRSLKSSILDTALCLTGKQLISGNKTFSDPCTFSSRSSINQILDTTQTGDISGNIFVGESGLFQNMGIGTPFFNRSDSPDYTLDVIGDSCFIGDATMTGDFRIEGNSLTIGDIFLSGDLRQTGDYYALGNYYRIGDSRLSGDTYQTGDLYRKGDTNLTGDVFQTGNSVLVGNTLRSGQINLIGNANITGNTFAIGDIYRSGDSFQNGDHTQTGDVKIYGDETVTEDIYLGEYLYHLDDKDTHLQFEDDQLKLQAGGDVKIILEQDESHAVKFLTSGEEQVQINKQGFVAINNTAPIGELSVTGDSYLECAFTTGQDGQWERILGGSDEVVSFVTPILGGQDSYKIEFPKTFGEPPAITVSLENDFGGPIVPYIVSGLNNFEYNINFGATLLNDGYKIHTSARPIGQSSVHKTTTQSFVTDIVAGEDIYEIFYPNPFHATPSVSMVIESDSINHGYFISGINTESYNIVFTSNTNNDCKIHTHAVR